MLDLQVSGLRIHYSDLDAPALDVSQFYVAAGELLVITGPSGSGKSTFINALTGLERPTHGHVLWGNNDIAMLTEGRRDSWRGDHVGLVMQNFHLFPGLSAIENILLPARLMRKASRSVITRANDLIAAVGLTRPMQKIETMSRGEMQRVAVARALLRQPAVLIADEPTASLDAQNGAAISELLLELAADTGATLIAVSHDPVLIDRVPRRIHLANGKIASDLVQELG